MAFKSLALHFINLTANQTLPQQSLLLYREVTNKIQIVVTANNLKHGNEVIFQPGKVVSEDGDPQNTIIWINGLSDILGSTQLQEIEFENWNYKYFKDENGEYIAISPKKIESLNNSPSSHLIINATIPVPTDTNENSANISFDYMNIQGLGAPYGDIEFSAQLASPQPRKPLTDVLKWGFNAGSPLQVVVSDSDENLYNNFKIYLTRKDNSSPVVKAGPDTKFIIEFVYAGEKGKSCDGCGAIGTRTDMPIWGIHSLQFK